MNLTCPNSVLHCGQTGSVKAGPAKGIDSDFIASHDYRENATVDALFCILSMKHFITGPSELLRYLNKNEEQPLQNTSTNLGV